MAGRAEEGGVCLCFQDVNPQAFVIGGECEFAVVMTMVMCSFLVADCLKLMSGQEARIRPAMPLPQMRMLKGAIGGVSYVKGLGDDRRHSDCMRCGSS